MEFSGHLNIGRARDGISSIDVNSAGTCITSWSTNVSPILRYSGRITRTMDESQYLRWWLPDMTSYFPGEAAIEQCTHIFLGPPPVALTAANEIVLPKSTLPYSSIRPTQTSIGSDSISPATAQPAGSSSSATPSRTSVDESTSINALSSAGEPEGPPSASTTGETIGEQEEQTSASTTGTGVAISPSLESGLGSPPGQGAAVSQGSALSRSVGPAESTLRIGSPEQQDTEQTSSLQPVAPKSEQAATQALSPIAKDPTTLASSTDEPGTKTFIHQVSSIAEGYSLPGPTISKGGEAAALSGTTYSVLPSGLGVVAVSNAGSTTLQASQLASHRIPTVPDSPNAYILPAQTLAAAGSAIAVSGTTYSALPENSGIVVVADEQTSVVAVSELTNVPVNSQISSAKTADGYVVDSSVTLTAGGPVAMISRTVYSALPSGFGVAVADESESDYFASYIAQGIGGTEQSRGDDEGGYIIGLDSVTASGGSKATTMSGVVYSVLPSGSGVLVVADGSSTTIEVSRLANGTGTVGGESQATSTDGSGDDPEQSMAVYTGASSSKTVHTLGVCGFLLFVVLGLAVGH